MFCKHCGSKIDDDAAFCPACGKPQGAAVAETGAAQVVPAAQGGGESYFDGGVFQRLGWKILGYLVTGFTLGICYPFAVNWMYSWEARHTVIDGRRLKFTGSAGGLFGTWILCLLLTFVTFGIYYFWVPLKIRKWREANTFFEDEIPTFDAEQRLRREKASRFDGGLMQYIGWNILGWLVTFFTLGICYPWAVQMVYSWEQRHKVYCKRRCTFDGRAVGLFGTWMLCLLLCLVTFGIYCFWVPLRIHRWKVRHTHLLADDTPAEEQESKGLTPAEERKSRELTPEERKLFARLSAVGPVLTVAGIVMQTLYFILYIDRYYRRHFFEFIAPQCLLLLCTVGLLVLRRVKIKNRSVVQLILITAALLFSLLFLLDNVLILRDLLQSFAYSLRDGAFRYAVVCLLDILFLLLPFAGVGVSFVGWFKERRAAAEAAGDAAGE